MQSKVSASLSETIEKVILMRNPLFLLIFFVLLGQFIITAQRVEAASTTTITFDNTSDLVNNFNPDSTPVFSNISNGGISNTGSVNVPLSSDDIWVTRQGYTVTGEGDKYIISAYFKIKDNSGYVGFGLTNSASGANDSYGSPAKGIGMIFQSTGGSFVSNRETSDINWTPNLVTGNWYKMVLEATSGSDRNNHFYDVKFQIWNSDGNGALGTLKTEQIISGLINNDLGTSNILHGYFSAVGSRIEKIDYFQVSLSDGPTFVEEGFPVVTTDPIGSVSINSVLVGGNVKDDQGSSVTARGICYGGESLPALSGTCTVNGSGTGAFSTTISGLIPSTVYHIRAYATNAFGTSYGEEKVFVTTSLEIPPTVTSSPAINIYSNRAELRGDITSIGTDNVSIRGFEYGTTTSYGTVISTTGDYVVGTYGLTVNKLLCSTSYHFRAFATNNIETSFGEDRTFITSKCPSSSGGSGSTVESRVINLIKMGKFKEAEELIRKYPNRFPNYTFGTLGTVSSKIPNSTNPSVNNTTGIRDLTMGMTGEDVAGLQKILINVNTGHFARGLAKIGTTGYFGNSTRNALAEYQMMNRITPYVGYFGPMTRIHMKRVIPNQVWW